MKRSALLALVLLVAVTGASASSGRTLRGEGVTLSLPAGWHGLVGGAGVQAADFPLERRARNSASLVRVRRGHVHLIVLNYGPMEPYLHFRASPLPLSFRKHDVLRHELEGFGGNDAFAVRTARVNGDMLELIADLGPKPLPRDALRTANRVLTTLHVMPRREIRARHGLLSADGVSLRLLDGWTGQMEIPPGHYGAQLVLRAALGGLHVDMLVYAESYGSGRHVALPVALTDRHLLHRTSPPLARSVFSNGGRSFEITATARSPRDLREANRLLATLRVVPRPWTLRCCNLSLRLPGTWRGALRPRPYPILELRGPGALVVLTELRPGEQASGRILRQNGRRFHVRISPASARSRADAVLATLRAERRS